MKFRAFFKFLLTFYYISVKELNLKNVIEVVVMTFS